jgi:hypothetical protein
VSSDNSFGSNISGAVMNQPAAGIKIISWRLFMRVKNVEGVDGKEGQRQIKSQRHHQAKRAQIFEFDIHGASEAKN